MISGADLQLRPAVLTDQRQIANLIHFSPHVHRHLDWRNPLDWIGSPPFFVIESQGQVVAALGCPPDPPVCGLGAVVCKLWQDSCSGILADALG